MFPRQFLAVFLLAAPAVLAQALPELGEPAQAALTPLQERLLGQSIMKEARRDPGYYDDAEATDYLTRVGNRLAAHGGDARQSFEFFLMKDPQINAFALPGGKVGVYTGLLKLAENDDELATVMGHEIGHAVARHGAERMTEAALIAGVGAVGAAVAEKKYGAQTSDLFAIAYGGGTTLVHVLPHSRHNESEADKMGMVFAAKAGYDPRAAVKFWTKMQAESAKKKSQLPTFLSTHPSDEKRVAEIQAYLPQVIPVYEANRNRG